MHINMGWWLNVPMVLNTECTLDFLHIRQIIQRSKQGSALLPSQILGLILLIGSYLLPCETRAFAPALDALCPNQILTRLAQKHDNSFRFKNVRTYLFGCVQIARNAIYKSAAAIAGAVVDQLLKAMSSVPILVKTSRL